MRKYTDEELIGRVWDQEKIRDLISRFSYYEAADRRAESMDRFWVSEPENRRTASFGRNWGFITGWDDIRAYYVDRDRFGGVGTGLMHPLSTKLLCLAEDGKTARGMWMGIAYETAPGDDGNLDAKWINERLAADFIKEDDGWKIWHLFIGTNYVLSVGEDYDEQPLNTRPITREEGGPDWYTYGHGREAREGLLALFDQIPEYPEREAFLDGRIPEEIYTALYNDPVTFPPLPEDYVTYDPARGYGPEGFARFAGNGTGRVF